MSITKFGISQDEYEINDIGENNKILNRDFKKIKYG